MIFLDNASTTRLCKAAVDGIKEVSEELYYNPSALYGEALKVRTIVEKARNDLAELVGAEKDEVYFTSCATESNNWAFEKGIKNKKGNIVVSLSEHASGYECALVQKSKGIDVRFVGLRSDGTIDFDDFISKIDENTCFASVIHCSNETGAVNDVAELVKAAKQKNPKIIFHSDGVQAFLKVPGRFKGLGVDLYSISAHKIGGLKGTGALIIKKGVNLAPLISGGGQEKGLRSGTENVAGIVAFAAAARDFKTRFDAKKIKIMREIMINALLPLGVKINGEADTAILSVSVSGIKAEVLQNMLSDKGILIGLGSACSSRARNNRVLSALGLGQKEIEGSIRISFGIENDADEVKYAAKTISEEITALRGNIK